MASIPKTVAIEVAATINRDREAWQNQPDPARRMGGVGALSRLSHELADILEDYQCAFDRRAFLTACGFPMDADNGAAG